MAVRVNTLSESEIRAIGDAFAEYEYAESEHGMSYLGKSKKAVSDYICAYARMALKERVLYSTSDKHEAFIVVRKSGRNMSLSSAKGLLGAVPGNADFEHMYEAAKG